MCCGSPDTILQSVGYEPLSAARFKAHERSGIDRHLPDGSDTPSSAGGTTARAAMFGTARSYIEDNLHELDLSPESVLRASHLSRPTLYRLFEHEGGLATYIRNRRLREAADELRR